MEYLNLTIVPPDIISTVDIEAMIEDLFLSALRAMFAHDPEFTYVTDPQAQKKLVLTLEYPKKKEEPMAKPHLFLSNIGYSVNLDNSIFRNFLQDRFDVAGYNNQSMQANMIPYSLVLTALGRKSVSKNLANRVINYMSITYKKVFDDLGLNIMSVSKAATSSTSKYPEEVFETSIQLQGRLEWTGTIEQLEKEKANVLRAVDVDTTIG